MSTTLHTSTAPTPSLSTPTPILPTSASINLELNRHTNPNPHTNMETATTILASVFSFILVLSTLFLVLTILKRHKRVIHIDTQSHTQTKAVHIQVSPQSHPQPAHHPSLHTVHIEKAEAGSGQGYARAYAHHEVLPPLKIKTPAPSLGVETRRSRKGSGSGVSIGNWRRLTLNLNLWGRRESRRSTGRSVASSALISTTNADDVRWEKDNNNDKDNGENEEDRDCSEVCSNTPAFAPSIVSAPEAAQAACEKIRWLV